MPPERQPTQKRRHLPFKPPSRASTTAGASKTNPSKPATKKSPKTNATASSSKLKPTSRPSKPAKPSSSRQRPSPSPSNESATNSDSAADNSDTRTSPRPSDSVSGSDDEAGANYILAEIVHGEPANEDVLSSDPTIPPKLLTKLVQHHFRNEKTKIAKDANEVVAKYIDVFVREAVARAAFERAEGGGGGGVADGFLEVEDLEKMGPQLAMDF
ncbi:CENP-S associating centromere protein X-domain-containing protein [Aspergillus varians]